MSATAVDVSTSKTDLKLSFNPEWMKSSADGPAPLLFKSSAAISQDSGPLAPVKLAKNRYGREEMLVLLPDDLSDILELEQKFPDFHSAMALPPVCTMPFTDAEQALLVQGVNSSKAIAAVNQVEKHNPRWTTVGRGTGMRFDEREPRDSVATQQRPDKPDALRDNIRRPFAPYRGGFGAGARSSEAENWRTSNTRPPENLRAQGLVDHNDRRRGPPQRAFGSPGKDFDNINREDDYGGARTRRRFMGPSNTTSCDDNRRDGLPEWATEEDENVESGSFDTRGQFKLLKTPSDPASDYSSEKSSETAALNNNASAFTDSAKAQPLPELTPQTLSVNNTAAVPTSTAKPNANASCENSLSLQQSETNVLPTPQEASKGSKRQVVEASSGTIAVPSETAAAFSLSSGNDETRTAAVYSALGIKTTVQGGSVVVTKGSNTSVEPMHLNSLPLSQSQQLPPPRLLHSDHNNDNAAAADLANFRKPLLSSYASASKVNNTTSHIISSLSSSINLPTGGAKLMSADDMSVCVGGLSSAAPSSSLNHLAESSSSLLSSSCFSKVPSSGFSLDSTWSSVTNNNTSAASLLSGRNTESSLHGMDLSTGVASNGGLSQSPVTSLGLSRSLIQQQQTFQTPTGLRQDQQNVAAYSQLQKFLMPARPLYETHQRQTTPPVVIEETFEKIHKDAETFIDSLPYVSSTIGVGYVVRGGVGATKDSPFQEDASTQKSVIRPTTLPVPASSESEDIWYYLDPQGAMQGPFDSKKMSAWFRMGYFMLTLLVKRKNDEQFVTLADLIKMYGRVPFDDMPTPTGGSLGFAASPAPLISPSMPAPSLSGHLEPQKLTSTIFGGQRDLFSGSSQMQVGISSVPGLQSSGVTTPQQTHGGLGSFGSSGSSFSTNNAHFNSLANASSALTSTNQRSDMHEVSTAAALTSIWSTPRPVEDLPLSSSNLQDSLVTQPAQQRSNQEPVQPSTAVDNSLRKDKELGPSTTVIQQLQEHRSKEEITRLPQNEPEQEQQVDDTSPWQQVDDKRQDKRNQKSRRKQEGRKKKEDIDASETNETKSSSVTDETQSLRPKQVVGDSPNSAKNPWETINEPKPKANTVDQNKENQFHSQPTLAAAAGLSDIVKPSDSNRSQQSSNNTASAPSTKWSNAAAPRGPTGSAPFSGTVQSLLEIQLEEQRQIEAERRQQAQVLESKKAVVKTVCSNASSSVWGNSTKQIAWDKPSSWEPPPSGGFWDDVKSQPKPAAQSQQKRNDQSSRNNQKKVERKEGAEVSRAFKKAASPPSDEFTSWCIEQIGELNPDIDGPMLVTFLKEVESPDEVENYVTGYCGSGKNVKNFLKAFLLKRSEMREREKQQAMKDELLMPAAALNPVKEKDRVDSSVNEKLDKEKKKKRSKMSKVLDGAVLGFTSAADPNRLNAGEIDTLS